MVAAMGGAKRTGNCVAVVMFLLVMVVILYQIQMPQELWRGGSFPLATSNSGSDLHDGGESATDARNSKEGADPVLPPSMDTKSEGMKTNAPSSSQVRGSDKGVKTKAPSASQGRAKIDLSAVDENARVLSSVTSKTWPKLKAAGPVDPHDPRLDFIKLNKVGGTSIATSLNNVAKKYRLKSSMGCKGKSPLPHFTITTIPKRKQSPALAAVLEIW